MMARRCLAILGLGLTLGSAGCRTMDAKKPLEPAIEETPHPPEPQPAPVVRNVTPKEEVFPHLFLRKRDVAADQIALAFDGLAVTKSEFAAGLAEEPAGAGDAEGIYAEQVRDELLLLSFLRDNDLMRDPDFESRARSTLRSQLAKLILDEIVRQQVTVSEIEIRQRYDRDSTLYRQPHRVSVRLILVQTQAEADAIQERLAAGEEFADLASELSLHTSRAQGGKMDPFSRGTLSSSIEDLAFSLRPGETGTISNSRGVWIIQKIADSPESVMAFDQVRAQIGQQLFEEKAQEVRRVFLHELKEKSAP